MIYPLTNQIKNFLWGSRTALTSLFMIPNDDKQPQAEVWMGSHPNGCSELLMDDNSLVRLDEFILEKPIEILGERWGKQVNTLPFLVKILAVSKPLSIQVHPNKTQAVFGFERENILGIPLDAKERNYKDKNHKPELVYAITPYLALNGFRPLKEICYLFRMINCPSLLEYVEELEALQTSLQLKRFFSQLMTLTDTKKEIVLSELKSRINYQHTDDLVLKAVDLIKCFFELYPNDIGLLSPLLLNIIELKPGEAMFLHAKTPHAYVRGVGVEVMANSDNVLRAGLTSKYIDVNELISNTNFLSVNAECLKLIPNVKNDIKSYPIPVDDFKFDVLSCKKNKPYLIMVFSAEILLCIEGEVTINCDEYCYTLYKGKSIFLCANVSKYMLRGDGVIARTYC